MLSFFSNPDKSHDKKLSGVTIDPTVTSTKEALRKLRDACVATAKFYHKHADAKKGAQHWALTLPELAEWSHHEAFCGADDAAESVYRDAAQLAAMSQLACKVRACAARDCAARGRGPFAAHDPNGALAPETSSRGVLRVCGGGSCAAPSRSSSHLPNMAHRPSLIWRTSPA
eukprot:4835645-Prymnesium_polylepis.2